MRFTNMLKSVLFAGSAAGIAMTASPALADHHEEATEAGAETEAAAETITVGGAEMLPSRNIVENAANSPIHTTLVSAVQAAQLVETLSGPGPFTVLAPTDETFALLPAETLTQLMSEAGRPQLRQILTYHVIPGALDAETLMGQIEQAGGELVVETVEGSPLTLTVVNDAVAVTDEQGAIGYVTQADVPQSNGYIHVINNVLIPNPPSPEELAVIAQQMAAERAAEAEADAAMEDAATDDAAAEDMASDEPMAEGETADDM